MFLEYFLRRIFQEKNYAAPILYIPVPQTGHLPLRAGLPFFMVTFCAFASSLFALHLTQYIDAIYKSPPLIRNCFIKAEFKN